MKLTDLYPSWSAIHDRDGMGVTFLCPHCKAQRLGVFFANPVDGGPPVTEPLLWQRTGDTFDTLTLTPSIDTTACGHWHGHITNGELTP